ncbi:daunorubicin resistance protein DrrA family ABC transporter ATP-binding protein [Pseudonocardia spinosispora]|uniref:daunorubicin resistance protein DrrA family ABC transporter ATP-binding protein n=1 Tax=Pseudonocardia spinosispora TaxID=103441 RepID=UPI000415BE88|nr:daunorubicin resistance protein DrrA family ABC transporter ATP-binding protein [Pseudonocardia spinosispora]
MDHTIQVEGLVKKFGGVTALAGVDFTAREGGVLGLLGPNGAGKTTAVRVLATLTRPDAGTVRVLGHDVTRDPAAVRARIALTGQYAAVDEALSGNQNLVLIARLLDLSRRAARSRAGELLEAFGLTDAADRPARTYSGGMRRRLDLAVSMLGRPDVLFLDEPTTGLDPRHRSDVLDGVRMLAAEGVTVLLTTQYLEEAEQLADDLVVIDHGRVIASGTPASLKAEVGGQRLHVRPLHRSDLVAVCAVVAEQTGGTAPTTSASGEVIVLGADANLLHRVGARLEADRLAVAELGLRLPSLDDVFLTLTGHPADEEVAA